MKYYCAICREEIKTKYPSQAKARTYCSKQCGDVGGAKKRENKVEKECIVCGAVFSIKKSHANKRETCSRDCKHKKHGDKIRGEKHFRWKGAKKKKPNSFIYKFRGGKYEHRYIMEQCIGRKLTSDEVVHHINGDPLDNRLDNLQVMSRAEHTKLHYKQGDIY